LNGFYMLISYMPHSYYCKINHAFILLPAVPISNGNKQRKRPLFAGDVS
jgi:hypothetical protein